MATYRTVGVADGISVGVAVGTGVALGARDRCASLAGGVRAGGVAAGEHAAANAAPISNERRSWRARTLQLMLPDRATGQGDAWYRQGRQTDRREPRNAVPPR